MEEGLFELDPLAKAKEKALEKEEAEKAKPEEPEPSSFEVDNPARCTYSQQDVLTVNEESRFIPLLKTKKIGCVILQDSSPDEPFELFSFTQKTEEEKKSSGRVGKSATNERIVNLFVNKSFVLVLFKVLFKISASL
ncbi:hypothetical protein GEMRC1_011440 [Eukaryota sp. GEM-RC1]